MHARDPTSSKAAHTAPERVPTARGDILAWVRFGKLRLGLLGLRGYGRDGANNVSIGVEWSWGREGECLGGGAPVEHGSLEGVYFLSELVIFELGCAEFLTDGFDETIAVCDVRLERGDVF